MFIKRSLLLLLILVLAIGSIGLTGCGPPPEEDFEDIEEDPFVDPEAENEEDLQLDPETEEDPFE